MGTRALFGTSSSQLMEKLLSQALMILQFRWEGGCAPNVCNADFNKETLWLWLKSSTCFKLSVDFGLPYERVTWISVYISSSGKSVELLFSCSILGGCCLWFYFVTRRYCSLHKWIGNQALSQFCFVFFKIDWGRKQQRDFLDFMELGYFKLLLGLSTRLIWCVIGLFDQSWHLVINNAL